MNILTKGKSLTLANDPITKKLFLSFEPPTMVNNQGIVDRVRERIATTYPHPVIPLSLMDPIVKSLRQMDWEITLTLSDTKEQHRVIHAEPGNNCGKHLGLAIDIGTTTVVAYLIDLHNGNVLSYESAYNQQVGYGEDILTRIHYAETPEKLLHLQQAVINTLNELISQLCQKTNSKPEEISASVVSGNTTMIHLFLGLSPDRLCKEPYLPTVNQPGTLTADLIGLSTNPRGIVYCLPSIGSYVGGDAIAGILVSEMHKKESLSLLVDIGTNGEILLGNKHWIAACAGAAGPALEGGVVSSGLRAEPGAIDSITIDPDSERVQYTTIENKKPIGICGSGLVDAIAALFENGLIDISGKFKDGRKAFVIEKATHTAHGKDIVITQIDIRNLLRTKAAVHAALEVLLESVGCTLDEVADFYAAGAFGNYINPVSAKTIGLYPNFPNERIHIIGNSSVEGARAALVDKSNLIELDRIVKTITYFEIGTHPRFMTRFSDGLYMPHKE